MSYRNNFVSTSILISLLFVSFTFAVACEPRLLSDPVLIIEVENNSDQTLTIYNNFVQRGEVAPGQTAKIHVAAVGVYLEARNSKGELVYSKSFTSLELHKAQYKIVIPASSTP